MGQGGMEGMGCEEEEEGRGLSRSRLEFNTYQK